MIEEILRESKASLTWLGQREDFFACVRRCGGRGILTRLAALHRTLLETAASETPGARSADRLALLAWARRRDLVNGPEGDFIEVIDDLARWASASRAVGVDRKLRVCPWRDTAAWRRRFTR